MKPLQNGQLFAGLLLLSAAATQGASFDRWHWRNPEPLVAPLPGVTYAAGQFVAVGGNYQGAILTSPDGTNWTQRFPDVRNQLKGIAHGQGLWVAVGASGIVLVSSNTISWTQVVSGVSEDLLSVAFADGLFVAVGDGGRILASENGVEWIAQISGTSEPLRDICHGQGRWMAVGGSRNDWLLYPIRLVILASENGRNWTVQRTTPSVLLEEVAYGNGTWVAVGYDDYISPPGYILTSSNGVDWVERSLPGIDSGILSLTGVHFADGRFVAGGYLGILTSTDGISWNYGLEYLMGNVSIAHGAGTWIATGYGGEFFSSIDATNWVSRIRGTVNVIDDMASQSNLIVAVGHAGTIVRSTNGADWDLVSSGTTSTLLGVTSHSNTWLAVGDKGLVVTSSDGLHWQFGTVGATNVLLYDIQGSPRGLVAVGTGGSIFSSSNGVEWARQNSGVSALLRAVAWGEGLWVVVGDVGVILTSSNSTDWVVQSSGQADSLGDVTHTRGLWLAVGYGSAMGGDLDMMFTSSNGVQWTRSLIPYNTYPNAVTWAEGRYMSVGAFNYRILISEDAFSWRVMVPPAPEQLGCVLPYRGSFIVAGTGGVIAQTDVLPLPPLQIRRQDEGLRLSWPDYASEFVLESNAGLATDEWTAVSPAPQTNSHTVLLPDPSRFFRLRRP